MRDIETAKMASPQDVTRLKILLVGKCGVGKSSLLHRFIEGCHDPDITPTLGMDYKIKYHTLGCRTLQLGLWELAGGGRFRLLNPHHYKGAHGAIFLYDITDRSSWESVPDLITECGHYTTNLNMVKMLVGTKADLKHRCVERREGMKIARHHAMMFTEWSAIEEGYDMDYVMDEFLQRILQTPALVQSPVSSVTCGGSAVTVSDGKKKRMQYSQVKRQHDQGICNCPTPVRKRFRAGIFNTSSTSLKILIIGDQRVGKSSVLMRFTDNRFDPNTPRTIGVDYKSKNIDSNGRQLQLHMWELAGRGRYRLLNPHYYNGAHGAIFVYDVTARGTFERVSELIAELNNYSSNRSNVVKLLIGNKVDKNDREVDRGDGINLARENCMFFLEASQKTRDSISGAINELSERILRTRQRLLGPMFFRVSSLEDLPVSQLYSYLLVLFLFSIVVYF